MRGICNSLQQRDHSPVQTIIRYASFYHARFLRTFPPQASTAGFAPPEKAKVVSQWTGARARRAQSSDDRRSSAYRPIRVGKCGCCRLDGSLGGNHTSTYIVFEGAVSLGLELVEIVCIHAHHLADRQPHSHRRTLCTSPGVTTAVDSMENSATAAADPVAIR
jgi:hypothetical protein